MPRRQHSYYVYFMASRTGVLYLGVTNDLQRRVHEHKNRLHEGFSKRYWCTKLVYFEHSTYIWGAIAREKEIKKWRRAKKLALVRSMNPNLSDLAAAWGWE